MEGGKRGRGGGRDRREGGGLPAEYDSLPSGILKCVLDLKKTTRTKLPLDVSSKSKNRRKIKIFIYGVFT